MKTCVWVSAVGRERNFAKVSYRELVERQLAVRHADLELGLSRAREQEPFVIHVSDLLDKAGIEYAVRMDKDFQTTFNLEYPNTNYDTFKRVVRQMISAYYCVCNDGDELEISSNRPDGYAVRIVFGDVPV
ncbi:TPA: hypothetical protein WHP42_002010 [Neisseria meningitidis]|uniref:hypothetical protein n=1 Tax=Neisseria meningitidis TaxID=487 RepID=UPI000C34D97E|nr:hypothetical protein [Neisseria meningitidis]MBW4002157.1 hypothetical protein [Neisseria meningitidis]MCL4995566.1 hypothetical protein [Neisseria meningitidis]